MLSNRQIKKIVASVTSLFDHAQASLMGRHFNGNRMFFSVANNAEPLDTIEGIYRYTLASMFGANVAPLHDDTIETLSEVAGNYLEAKKLKTKNQLIADLKNAKTKKDIVSIVKRHIESSEKYVEMLISNETRIAQAYASREGITRLSEDIGDKDPTVVFLGVVDKKQCKYCKMMYHDTVIPHKPKPYKLSQVKQGYFKPKEWDSKTPYQAPIHPSCRHSMSYVAKGYGFDNSGMPVFKGLDYDYFSDYWGTKKKEPQLLIEALEKSDPDLPSLEEMEEILSHKHY